MWAIKMKSRKERFHRIDFILVIAFTVTIVLPIVLLFRAPVKAQERKERLLCETDYHILLNACRDLLERATQEDLKFGPY